MATELPWRRRSELAALMAAWRRQYLGRCIHRVGGGPGWLSLSVVGQDLRTLFCVARPGAALLWDADQPPPQALRSALGRTQHPPASHFLGGASLVDIQLWPVDLVVALHFRGASELRFRLLHQLFGPRGNLALLDGNDRLLWSLYRPLHPVLTGPAGAATGAPPQFETPSFPDSPGPAATAGRAVSGRITVAADAPGRGEGPQQEPPSLEASIQRLFRAGALAHLERSLQTEWGASLQREVSQGRKTAERLVANLTRDLAQADRGQELREKAETLAAQLAQVSRGAASVTLPSPATGQMLQIALDPALSPAANLEYYFRLARKADRGQAIIASRLAGSTRQLARWRLLQAELDELQRLPANRLSALWQWRQQNADLLRDPAPAVRDRPGGPVAGMRDAELETRPFRRYRIENRWEIWVGRSNEENDLMTHKSAAPTDYWLHAQGVPGSHVILRTMGRPEQVPRRVLQKAAALAALHSKGRHASLVPVIYTLRKYVRKPRKSPPGTAACLRQKSLFAVPELPGDVQLVSRDEPG